MLLRLFRVGQLLVDICLFLVHIVAPVSSSPSGGKIRNILAFLAVDTAAGSISKYLSWYICILVDWSVVLLLLLYSDTYGRGESFESTPLTGYEPNNVPVRRRNRHIAAFVRAGAFPTLVPPSSQRSEFLLFWCQGVCDTLCILRFGSAGRKVVVTRDIVSDAQVDRKDRQGSIE